jgi:photosystem II stability/assembly factor-like uncharacterized protein
VERRLPGSALGLVALAVVVAALAGFAMRTPSPPDETVDKPGSRQTGSPAATPSSTATKATSSPSPTTTPSAEALSETVLLSTAKNGAAVRGLAGDCESDGAVLELSDDGGASFDEVDVPARALLRVKAVSDSETWVVGTDKNCKPRFIRTTDAGKTWRTNTGTGGAWHLLPTGATQLHAPKNNIDAPCADGTIPIDLAAVNDSTAAVLCEGGRVHTTQDAGSSWKKAGTVSGATALAFGSATTGFAAAPGGESCDGTAVSRTTDRGVTWEEMGCVDGASDGVALAFTGTSVGVLATVDEAWQTKNAGRTWTRL